MNLKKLAKYFTGNFPNSKAIPIADFVNILENNLWLEYDKLSNWKHLSGAIVYDYKKLFEYILEQEHWEWIIWKLLNYFDLPNNFLFVEDLTSYQKSSLDDNSLYTYKKIDFTKFNETEFSEQVVMPLLYKMWYEKISYKWKVNQTDSWTDFYAMQFTSPWWIVHYTWVQVKAIKMTEWDTSKSWKETINLIDELKTWFSQDHIMIEGNKVYVSEFLIFNNKVISESVRTKIHNNKLLKDEKIIIYDEGGVSSLIEKYY